MKRKNRLKTNSLRTIKKAFPRFLSLIIMSLLGVLVFTGLLATSPNMLKTLDNYYDKNNVYDIKIVSTMGLIEDDIEALQSIEEILDIEGSYSKDILLADKDQEYVINISSIPNNINKIKLIEGHLPNNDKEIVIEKNFINDTSYKIGDTITIKDEDFNNKELTIVGTIDSPLYINNTDVNQSRGSSVLGTGSVNYYSYVPSTNFNQDYYTSIYLTVKNAQEEITSKDEYLNLIENVTNKIEDIRSNQEENRYNKIYNEVLSEIEDQEQELYEELKDAKKELDDAKKELDDAKDQLDSSKKQLNTFYNSLASAKKDLDTGKKAYEKALKEANLKESELSSNITTLKSTISTLEKNLSYLDKSSEEYQIYSKKLNTLKEQLQGLETLKSTKETLESGEKSYNSNYAKYEQAYTKYKKGLSSYNKGLSEYKEGLKEYEDGKKEAEEKLTDAKEELNAIEKPSWYIYDRSDYQTYSTYIGQTESIKNLSAIFPLVFYAVAILVSLISMNRMVEDDRGEIGTLKSLGFENKEIISKYIHFSLIATLIGGVLGNIIGLTAIPYLIFIIYGLLFEVPNFYIGLNPSICIAGLLIAIICICGSTIITAYKVLKEKPSTLMRPKPPTSGKKILFENIKPLWHHLKFSNKITIRNIFRYKKRVFVTIFGIMGCTALMLCGFGIKDSIVDITTMQYEETFTYDAIVYTNDLNIKEVPTIFNNDLIKETFLSEQISATLNESDISMLVFESKEEFSKIIKTITKEDKPVTLEDNKVIITDKLADIYEIKEGDTITVLDSNKNSYKLVVSNIVKNYMGHYIYLDKSTLEKYKTYEPNTVYLKTTELTEETKDQLSQTLLENDSIINVIHKDTLIDSRSDMLKSLDKIIVVLILLAASLSFVVLYNLSNINITERKREIATLKVLGFFDKEVDNYITKENIILTIIGIALGLIFGNFLTYIVIGTVEMENSRFLREISLNSYIYTSIISFTFTLIVNYVTHFSLKKINMIESLKSVE